MLLQTYGAYKASLIITICSLKMFRCGYSDTPRQHIVLILTYLFFNYDYKHFTQVGIAFTFVSILELKTVHNKLTI